jgi:hypothetical protein
VCDVFPPLLTFFYARRVWETKLIDVFDRRGNKTCDYVLLRSEQVGLSLPVTPSGILNVFQLVGTALMIFVKSELTSVIRNVEGTSRKVSLASEVLIRRIHEPSSLVDGNARDVWEQRGRCDPPTVP